MQCLLWILQAIKKGTFGMQIGFREFKGYDVIEVNNLYFFNMWSAIIFTLYYVYHYVIYSLIVFDILKSLILICYRKKKITPISNLEKLFQFNYFFTSCRTDWRFRTFRINWLWLHAVYVLSVQYGQPEQFYKYIVYL